MLHPILRTAPQLSHTILKLTSDEERKRDINWATLYLELALFWKKLKGAVYYGIGRDLLGMQTPCTFF